MNLACIRTESCVLRVGDPIAHCWWVPEMAHDLNPISRLMPVARCRGVHPRIRCQLPLPFWCQHMRWSTATQSIPVHIPPQSSISYPDFLSFSVTNNFGGRCDPSYILCSCFLSFPCLTVGCTSDTTRSDAVNRRSPATSRACLPA